MACKTCHRFFELFAYSYCGLHVLSKIAFPELPQSKHDKGWLLFSLEPPINHSIQPIWLHHWLSQSGDKLLSYCIQDSYHWLRFPGLADFRISANAREISCRPLPEIPQETLRHLFLDQVLPRCLAHRGRIMLHASAVQLEQGLLLCIGDSGAGKSTLAGIFHQAGSPVMSDDCVWVKKNKDQIRAVPSYGGLRLWEDSLQVLFSAEQNIQSMAHYSTKKRVPLNENDMLGFGSGIPILAVIVLSPLGQSPDQEVILDRLSHREAFIAMMKQTFQLNLMDLERMTRHMQALGRIVPRLLAFRLSMPRDYDLLPIVRQKILEIVL